MLAAALVLSVLAAAPEPGAPTPEVGRPEATKPDAPKTSSPPSREWLFEPRFEARLVSGAEWDSNARRAVGATRDRGVVGDALLRLLADADLTLDITRRDQLRVQYVLGAKRFFQEESEDLLVHDVLAASWHALTPALSFTTLGSWRALRLRSSLRDYSLAVGGGGLLLDLGLVSVAVEGAYHVFTFRPVQELSSAGPAVRARAVIRPSKAWSLEPLVQYYLPDFHGNWITRSIGGSNVLGVCSPPECDAREDRELSLLLRASYRRGFVFSAEAGARLQRSNSDLENADRYRLSISATLPLVLGFVGSAAGALQYNRGLSETDQQLLGEDDENQNRLEVQLSRKVAGAIGLDLRYSLFANQFATQNVRFLRQTIYLGVSYELGPGS